MSHSSSATASTAFRRRRRSDPINVAAAASGGVPEVLEQQLAVGGRLVIPVGADVQRLVLSRRTDRGFERTELEGVRFVPLVRD